MKNKKYYLLVLVLIFIIILYIYFFQKEYLVLTNPHYGQYYFTSIVMGDTLRNFQFEEFSSIFVTSYVDKIIFLRSSLFFALFGHSVLNFSISGALLNIILFLIIARMLLYYYTAIDSLLLLSLFLFQWITVYSFFSPYVGLHIALFIFIFFMYVDKFMRVTFNRLIILSILIFLLLLTKNVTYILLPFFYICLIFKSRNYINRTKSLFLITFFFFLGFLLYMIVIGFGLNHDLSSAGHLTLPNQGNLDLSPVNRINLYISENISEIENFWYLKIFPSSFLNYLLLFSVIFLLFKKPNIWLLFYLISQIFFITKFGILNFPPIIRYFLPFYFVFFKIIFDGTRFFFNNKKSLVLFIIIIIFVINTSPRSYFYDSNLPYAVAQDNYLDYFSSSKNYLFDNFFYYLSSNETYYVLEDGGEFLLDYIHLRGCDECLSTKHVNLTKRFQFKFIYVFDIGKDPSITYLLNNISNLISYNLIDSFELGNEQFYIVNETML